jgi:hypothetical protein
MITEAAPLGTPLITSLISTKTGRERILGDRYPHEDREVQGFERTLSHGKQEGTRIMPNIAICNAR